MEVTSFVFANDTKHDINVAIRTRLDKGAHGIMVDGEPADEFFVRSNLQRKLWKLVSPNSYKKHRNRLIGYAESVRGIFAAVLAGDPYMTKRNGGVPLEGSPLNSIVK